DADTLRQREPMIEMAVSLLRSAILPLLYPLPSEKRKSKNLAGPTPALFSLFASRDRLLLIIFLSVFSFLLL
ncbi:MAG: hypothetical protein IIW62_04765, partial [Selenomonadales bacterium]|nr:hypothetical protein [Selenomonadales bacterium]